MHVYEQAREIRQVGAGIGLRPPTVELFRKWGIFDAIAAMSSPSDYLEILTADGGHVLAQEEWPGIHDFAQLNQTRIIHRGDFIAALLGALPKNMVHIGRKLTGITDHGNHAALTFESGEPVMADLVIGADGIRSLVRQQLFSDRQPVFSREHAYRAVICADDAYGLVTDDNPRFYMGQNGTIVYNLPLRHRGQLSYDITAPSDDDAWAPKITNDYLVSLLDGFDERIVKIAGELDTAQSPAARCTTSTRSTRGTRTPSRSSATRHTRCCTTRARARTRRSRTPTGSPARWRRRSPCPRR